MVSPPVGPGPKGARLSRPLLALTLRQVLLITSSRPGPPAGSSRGPLGIAYPHPLQRLGANNIEPTTSQTHRAWTHRVWTHRALALACSDWAPSIEAAARALLRAAVISYCLGYALGSLLHRLNDRLTAHATRQATGGQSVTAGAQLPQQGPLTPGAAAVDHLNIHAPYGASVEGQMLSPLRRGAHITEERLSLKTPPLPPLPPSALRDESTIQDAPLPSRSRGKGGKGAHRRESPKKC